MHMFRRAALVAASLTLACTAPALGQNSPFTGGEYLTVASITIDDGHTLEYENYLAGQWRANQEFAKSQGWISSYEVLNNVNKREGEPDLILVTRYRAMPDGAEGERRAEALRAHLRQTDTQMDTASGTRARYRHVLGSQLWQVMNFRP
jgi:hypothetical protein